MLKNIPLNEEEKKDNYYYVLPDAATATLEELELLLETSEDAIYKYEDNPDKLLVVTKLYHDLIKNHIRKFKKELLENVLDEEE
jgi:hypothetical protein